MEEYRQCVRNAREGGQCEERSWIFASHWDQALLAVWATSRYKEENNDLIVLSFDDNTDI